MLRKALLVSPYFVPSNLAGVQRVRVLASALHHFGWDPIVLTVDPSYYEEAVDPASMHLLPEGLSVERVQAFSSQFLRPLGIGDVSLRAYVQLKQRIERLVHAAAPRLIFVTVLPGYTSLLGSWAKQRFGLPFVLDYQDPWVPAYGGDIAWSKRRMAVAIARWLEPKVLPHVDALTAVSDETLDSLRSRNLIPEGVPIEIVPIGADRHDHRVAAQHGASLIKREHDGFHIAYVGTLTERMLAAFEAFLSAVVKARNDSDRNVIVHVIGSSGQPEGSDQHNLGAIAARLDIDDGMRLHPARVGYLDALRTMQEADLLVLIGSTDRHYTASKLFPYWLSGVPILGIFHRRSTIVSLSRELGGVRLMLYDETFGPETTVGECANAISQAARGEVIVSRRNEGAFSTYSAEGIAQRFARLFETVAERCA